VNYIFSVGFFFKDSSLIFQISLSKSGVFKPPNKLFCWS